MEKLNDYTRKPQLKKGIVRFSSEISAAITGIIYDDVALVLLPSLDWMETPCDANGISIRVFYLLLTAITFLCFEWYRLRPLNFTARRLSVYQHLTI